MLSVVHSSDPPVLPIVYEFPQCDTIVNGSILNCSQSFSSPFPGPPLFQDGGEGGNPPGVLGRLIGNIVGTSALVSVVGVRCDGESLYCLELHFISGYKNGCLHSFLNSCPFPIETASFFFFAHHIRA